MGLVGMMLTATNLNAQNHSTSSWTGGLFERGMTSDYAEYSNSRGLVNINSSTSTGITNDDFGAPLGSGIAILIGAGLGYVALKKKEDQQ